MTDLPQSKEAIARAIGFMERAHRGRKHAGGGPYSDHPRAAFAILVGELGVHGLEEKVAVLLHDVVRDSHYTAGDIRANFGDAVGEMVNALTRRDREGISPEQGFLDYADALSKASDAVKIVKIAERAHNLRTLGCREMHFQKKYLDETEILLEALTGCSRIRFLAQELKLQRDRVFAPGGRRVEYLIPA